MEKVDVGSRRKAAYSEGFLSIIINALLFAVKYYVGLLFNSIAVTADAYHTLSDSLTSIILIIGHRIASKPPDREHPFGHGRAEIISGLIIGVSLGVVSFEFAVSSYEKLVNHIPLIYSDILIYTLLVTAVAKAILSLYAYRLGKRYKSRSILADMWHHVSDLIATLILAIAIFVGRDYWWIDGVLGLAVSFVITWTAIRIVLDASSELMGKKPSLIEIEKLQSSIRKVYNGFLEVHHIHFHKYGDHVEVTLHIKLPGEITLNEAHKIATLIENEIREKLGYEATIHIEPFEQVEHHVD